MRETNRGGVLTQSKDNYTLVVYAQSYGISAEEDGDEGKAKPMLARMMKDIHRNRYFSWGRNLGDILALGKSTSGDFTRFR